MEILRSFSVTKTGSKHDDGVCQDASESPDIKNAAVVIVADGHGSSRCFRSHVGSSEAVRITAGCIESFIKDSKNILKNPVEAAINKGNDGKAELRNLGRQIINKWFNAVMKHEEANPLEKDVKKMEKIPEKYRDRYLLKDPSYGADYRCHAYGTTLIAIAMATDYWFGIQVGDGKCAVLYEDGSWAFPIPPDDRCSHNTTTSICDDEPISALEELRCWFGFRVDSGKCLEFSFGADGQGKDSNKEVVSPPLAIFIGSDGVEDSYPRIENDRYVVNFYRNRVVSVYENGFESAKEEIEEWAKRFADRESTDDVSIAGIVGDLTDKKSMIEKMKQESTHHETSELAASKRRDADEKKDALTNVEKHSNAVIASQKHLEGRIATIESELSTLDSKKKSYEMALSKSKAEIEESNRSLMDYQGKIHGLERNKSEHLREEQIISAKIAFAEDYDRSAKKDLKDAEREYTKKENSLRKKNDAYDKYLHKISKGKTKAIINGQEQIVIGSQTTITAVTVVAKGNITDQVTAQFSPASPTFTAQISANVEATDATAEYLMREVEKIAAELQTSQTRAVAAKQKAETKSRDLSMLHQQLFDTQQHTRQVKSEIKRIKQNQNAVDMQNQNQHDKVRKYKNDIAETERNIRAKQAEIDKLKGELETLKEQNKKQTDTLNTIKAAWERAEAEAIALEAILQNNNQDGRD